jgi:hypothetical protein
MPEQSEDREAEAAAAEAAAIGGPDPDPDVDPARRAVDEGGGGEAEGFEQAEKDLISQASHESAGYEPTGDAFTPEAEPDPSLGGRGEPDEVDPTEVTSDPNEDPTIRAADPAWPPSAESRSARVVRVPGGLTGVVRHAGAVLGLVAGVTGASGVVLHHFGGRLLGELVGLFGAA